VTRCSRGTRRACVAALQRALEEGACVAIDRCNFDADQRADFIAAAAALHHQARRSQAATLGRLQRSWAPGLASARGRGLACAHCTKPHHACMRMSPDDVQVFAGIRVWMALVAGALRCARGGSQSCSGYLGHTAPAIEMRCGAAANLPVPHANAGAGGLLPGLRACACERARCASSHAMPGLQA